MILLQDGLEKQMGVNHFGHFLLTNLLLPKLLTSSPSRIVVLSSVAHTRAAPLDFSNLNWDQGYEPGAAYNASKLANLLFVRELARRLHGTGVTVNAVHPGLVYTDLFRNLATAKSVTRYILGPFMWLFLRSPRVGAQTTVTVALSEQLDGVSGAYFADCEERQPAPAALDDVAAQRLWSVSEKWTGLDGKLWLRSFVGSVFVSRDMQIPNRQAGLFLLYNFGLAVDCLIIVYFLPHQYS